MSRIVWVVPSVLLVFGSHTLAAQESYGDTARWIAEIRIGVNGYQADVQARTKELGRKIDVLGSLTAAADAVSPIAMSQSLTRARQKVEEARRTADEEPALGEPVPAVLDVVSQSIASPPFGMPADKLRARLFVEIGKLEEDILRQAGALQREADQAESFARALGHIQDSLRAIAVAGGKASLQTRRVAIKSDG